MPGPKSGIGRLAVLCAALGLLCACGGQASQQAAGSAVQTASAASAVQEAVQEPVQGSWEAPPLAESLYHEQEAAGENGVLLDVSCAAQGYVAVSAVSDSPLKFQVVYGESKYNYDLPQDGTPQCFVLQSGSGAYTLRVMKNTQGNRYAELYAQTIDVTLESEFAPFLRPSQMVDYSADSQCVAQAAALASTASDDVGVVAAVYDHLRQSIAYDNEKAATVESGYLPDPDATLASGKGICFDYAALAAAMLRSQGIPTKLVMGYVDPGEVYHAWNMVWLEEEGWITVHIQAPKDAWSRIDITFAASNSEEFTGEDFRYTDRYEY